MNKIKVVVIMSVLTIGLVAPLAFASTFDGAYFSSFIAVAYSVVTNLVIVVIGIGLLVFLWGVVQYITAGADEERKKSARSLMIWGIIGLFVMVAAWGLVRLIASIAGVGIGGSVSQPTFRGAADANTSRTIEPTVP